MFVVLADRQDPLRSYKNCRIPFFGKRKCLWDYRLLEALLPLKPAILLLAMAVSLAAIANRAASSPVERSVEARGPAGLLKGTMLGPPTLTGPVILIIPGSGRIDRDGNGPPDLKASTYKLLAEGLAGKGVTTVRIDKRGLYGSAGAAADSNALSISDYAADVRSWLGAIRRETGASCVWLLGHSEGGLVALTASSGKGICGLILIATAGRPMGQVIRDQLRTNAVNAALIGQALPAIDALEAGRHVDVSTLNPALLPLFNSNKQDFLINEFSLDPARLIANYRKPVLIMQGERDIQISVSDGERLKRAAPHARLLLLPNANHVLKIVTSDDWAANTAAYADPHLPLAPGVIEGIAEFMAMPAKIH